MRHGKGRLVSSNGDYYCGDFQEDEFHGKGILYQELRQTEYDGDFFNGVKHGKGLLKFADGSFYEGDFHGGLMEG